MEHQGGDAIGAIGHQWPNPLAPDVRHDLRHSASTIIMLAAAIRAAPGRAGARAALDGITSCARNILDMVAELGQQPVDDHAVDLAEIANESGGRAALLYHGTLTVHAESAIVAAQNLEISRLFDNLIQNACRAAGSDGVVHVSVGNEGPWCVLRVADSGAGFQDPSPGGTGIGLGLIAGIAVRLHGNVTLERGPLGGGLVTVHLPRPAAHASLLDDRNGGDR